ncbi:MAG: DnaJ domain-containing protein [Candidatus Omnitrophica bacterium]|nr:DnaJ domain-containing protein [Candidatus Omnitrophota bacterium]
MADKRELDEARRTLGLGQKAAIPEIKQAYRRLSLKYHPDKCSGGDKAAREEKFKRINRANEILIEYCLNYRIPLSNDEKGVPSKEKHIKEHLKRFYDGWWADLGDD